MTTELWHTVNWTVVDDLPEHERKSMFVMPRDSKMKMSKLQAFEFLKAIKLYWEKDTEEFMISEDTYTAFHPLTENACNNFLSHGIDFTGSPGTEEQEVVNMMKVSHPWLPKTLFDQLEKFRLIGRELRGWSRSRKIGITIHKGGKAEMSAGLRKKLNKEKYHKLSDSVLILH